MEIKINREIRDYKENIFFGLSLRQLIFSLLACGVAVGIYLGLRDALGTETVSWLCILGAAPFAAMGFVKYHGMTAEKFFAVWLRSEFLVPKRLTFRPTDLYWEAMREQRKQEKKRSAVSFGAFVPKFTTAHGAKKGGAARNAEKLKKSCFAGTRSSFVFPAACREVIPIRTVWKSGIFLVGANRYSRTWQFSDINYALAGEENQKSMLLGYSGLLNLCDSNASTKFSAVTRKLNRRDFEDYIMIPYANDGHDHYRREYNAMLLEKSVSRQWDDPGSVYHRDNHSQKL